MLKYVHMLRCFATLVMFTVVMGFEVLLMLIDDGFFYKYILKYQIGNYGGVPIHFDF